VEDQVLVLDEIVVGKKKVKLLKIDGGGKEDMMRIPNFCQVTREVTGEPEFSNEFIHVHKSNLFLFVHIKFCFLQFPFRVNDIRFLIKKLNKVQFFFGKLKFFNLKKKKFFLYKNI